MMDSTSTCYCYFETRVGRLFVQGDGQFVTGLYLPDHKGWQGPDARLRASAASFLTVREQLEEYFAGERQRFDVPVRLQGTPFQQSVWAQLAKIPFGQTINYAELARRVGQPTATRAVGNANGRNPISIIVPCHRVIGSNGKLTGYAGGQDKKQWLLDWERNQKGAIPAA